VLRCCARVNSSRTDRRQFQHASVGVSLADVARRGRAPLALTRKHPRFMLTSGCEANTRACRRGDLYRNPTRFRCRSVRSRCMTASMRSPNPGRTPERTPGSNSPARKSRDVIPIRESGGSRRAVALERPAQAMKEDTLRT
jgi:hypothetical protein